MDTHANIMAQEGIESRYNRNLIDGYVRDAVENTPEIQEKINHGVQLLNEWMAHDWYDSKASRLSQLMALDLREMVTKLFIGIAYVLRPELFTSVSAQLAGRLGFDDKREAIQTVAEMLAVLCHTDAFDITKDSKMASLMLVSRLPLPDELKHFIDESEYLPPMVCEPLELKNNYDSGYLSHRDSVILGKGNHHNGNVCLDVLNIMNRIPLSLDIDFLLSVEEEPTSELETAEQRDMWIRFKAQSERFYLLMYNAGNKFYLTHKVDKRGRIYAQGYHITTQGSAYKKAMVELHKKELVEGVPPELLLPT